MLCAAVTGSALLKMHTINVQQVQIHVRWICSRKSGFLESGLVKSRYVCSGQFDSG